LCRFFSLNASFSWKSQFLFLTLAEILLPAIFSLFYASSCIGQTLLSLREAFLMFPVYIITTKISRAG
jgi:hypothetical protein